MSAADTMLAPWPDRTPCCDRWWLPLSQGRYACRGCGLIYRGDSPAVKRDVTRQLWEAFRLPPPPVRDDPIVWTQPELYG